MVMVQEQTWFAAAGTAVGTRILKKAIYINVASWYVEFLFL